MIRGVLQHHKDYLPITPKTPMISLGEGDTPLVKSMNLANELGVGELYFKLEGCNPTGSFISTCCQEDWIETRGIPDFDNH